MTEQQLIDEGYKDGKKSFDFYVKEFGEHFKFDKVHKAMTALNWCWSFGKDELGQERKGVPDITTLKNRAYSLLKEAYDENKQISTAGFTAGWDSGELYLVFNLEEWSV